MGGLGARPNEQGTGRTCDSRKWRPSAGDSRVKRHDRRRRARSRSSWWSSVGGWRRYAPGVTPWTLDVGRGPPTARAAPARGAVKQVVQRSNCCFDAVGVPDRRQLVQHTGGGVVAPRPARGGARRRRRRTRSPPGGHRAGGWRRSGRRPRSRRARRGGRSRPGRGRSWRRTRPARSRSRTSSSSNVAARLVGGRGFTGEPHELRAVVDADDVDSRGAPARASDVPARTRRRARASPARAAARRRGTRPPARCPS